jgi:hypothetical protein
MACPLNGRRACGWEKMLATYIARYIFPTVQWYRSTRGHRTLFWFYGPWEDVQNAVALFRELLLTIATAAHLQYGSHTRGSGASYAEGYISGLPRSTTEAAQTQNHQVVSQQALIHTRMIALRSAAEKWLETECNIKLTTGAAGGRYDYDGAAAHRGKLHGATHPLTVPGARPRITQRALGRPQT